MTWAPAALAQTSTPRTDPAPAPAVVDDIIVTAQKREQSVQDVPIAVTALSSEALQSRQIEGGSELLRAVPNVTFSKANFSMYNFSIRGIGTKAVSASSDPAVAVSFNNTPLIRNRLFEQEYLDVDRVEVLRGPQGTLYGRNATGGVVNMFPQLPRFASEGFVTGELGNYESKRAQAMVNIPLGETFAVRGAFALTKRDGFDYNSFNDTHVNDRDLFTTRLSARWEPTEAVPRQCDLGTFRRGRQPLAHRQAALHHRSGPDPGWVGDHHDALHPGSAEPGLPARLSV
ncbi:TonB-dependent receptor [Brevundimonas sp. SORGH_AS_0993]|uniref:TonB-dependent receptor n=1 Tax=Brevundimonas sp. SORGH_AS_0993 TaxID=3041794 RepID=UPI0027D7FB90|nr:TonB-dependent receptor [Brevundimonas sp. SORGH_AS_0993]